MPLRNCLENISELHPEMKDAINSFLDKHLKNGLPERQAEIKAVEDYAKKINDDVNGLRKKIKLAPNQYTPHNPAEKIKEIEQRYAEKEVQLKQSSTGETIPPVESKVEAEESFLGKKKGLLNRLYEAKNISEEVKSKLKEEGLEYKPSSQQEAAILAKGIIEEDGIDAAVLKARANTFGGDVNTLVQLEALNKLKLLEDSATTPEAKLEYAKKFAEISAAADKWLREGGRANSAVNYFYKKSPVGVEIKANKEKRADFEKWAAGKEKDWKEVFEEIKKEPEFEQYVSEKVREELKKERSTARAARKEKVHAFFDKAKKEFKGGAAYSTIIPPKIILKALEGMEKAYDAGEAIVKIVQDAIDYISKEMGATSWDKEKFRKQWEEKLWENEQKSSKTKAELMEQKRLRILDKFRKKLKGLSEKEKDQVIKESFKQLIENGALDYPEFKEIIGRVTGKTELTPEQGLKLRELVNKANSVDEAIKKAQQDRTTQSLIDLKKTQHEAAKASRELAEMMDNHPSILSRLNSIIQLNTLGIPALINNPIYNVWNQVALRFPIGMANTVIDRSLGAISSMIGKKYNPETDVITAQSEFFKKLGLGTRESLEQFVTGLNRADYTQKEVYGQQIRPATAWIDLYKAMTGKKKLSKGQIIDKTLQGTVGAPAEIVARVLNLGDKPMRFGAEGAQAAVFAKSLGLKGLDKKFFIEFPREEAYSYYKKQGLSDTEAGQKADYIADTITKEGERATFQQDNILNDILGKVFGNNKSGAAQLVKTLTISPYIKIPTNAYWSYYNLINPEIALLQSVIYGSKAAAKYKNPKAMFPFDRPNTSAAKDLHEARYWMAHAMVGVGLRMVIANLVYNGIFNSPNDEKNTKKERMGEEYYEPQGSVNLSKLKAYVNGENPADVKGGLIVNNKWFAQLGTMGGAMSRKLDELTPEQRKKQDEMFNALWGGMEKDALKDMENGVFANASSIMQAFNSPDGAKRYGQNVINLLTNAVQPAAFSQISRAKLENIPRSKGDSFYDEVKNNMLARSEWLRDLSGQYPKSKMNIWGESMKKPGSTIEKLFGIVDKKSDEFAWPLYKDYKRTNNTKFFPPSVKPEINVNGIKTQLKTDDAAELERYVGQERKSMVAPYVNDMATFAGSGKKYSQMDDDDKIDKLNILYEEGYKNGLQKFLLAHPEYGTENPYEIEEQRQSKKESNEEFRQSIEQ